MAELAGGRAPGRLVLTTYHSVKGREFSAVVLPGLVEGLVPFYFADRGISAQDLETARRLFYAATVSQGQTPCRPHLPWQRPREETGHSRVLPVCEVSW